MKKPFSGLKKIYHVAASQTGAPSSITNITKATEAIPYVARYADAVMVIGPPWTRVADPLADSLTMACLQAVRTAGLELIWGERLLHDWGTPKGEARELTVLAPRLYIEALAHVRTTADRLAQEFRLDYVPTALDAEFYGDYPVNAWLNNNHPLRPELLRAAQQAVQATLGVSRRLSYILPSDSGLKDACGWLWRPLGEIPVSEKSYYLRNPSSWFGAVSAPAGVPEVCHCWGVHVDLVDSGPSGPWSPETVVANLSEAAIRAAHPLCQAMFIYTDPLQEPGLSQRFAAAAAAL